MSEQISKVNTGFSLADAELKSYFYSYNINKLILEIELWNEQVAVFEFADPILHIDRFKNSITNLCKNTGQTQLLNETLRTTYEIIPKDHPYKLYQFLDLDKSPCIEIICEKLNFQMKK